MVDKYFISQMQPGETLMVVCRDAAALDSVYRLAMDLRSAEENKAAFAVSRGATTMTVVIRRWVLEGEKDSKFTRTVIKE